MDKIADVSFAREVETIIKKYYPASKTHTAVTVAYKAVHFVEGALEGELPRKFDDENQSHDYTPTKCLLLSLPAEILDRIWTLCVVLESKVSGLTSVVIPKKDPYARKEYFWIDNGWKPRHYQPALQPAISRVCRQARQESLPLLYAKNRFHVLLDASRMARSKKKPDNWCPGLRWIRDIGPQNAKCLKKVYWRFKSRNMVSSAVYIHLATTWLLTKGVSQSLVDELGDQLRFHG